MAALVEQEHPNQVVLAVLEEQVVLIMLLVLPVLMDLVLLDQVLVAQVVVQEP
jgi:hypothetical protein